MHGRSVNVRPCEGQSIVLVLLKLTRYYPFGLLLERDCYAYSYIEVELQLGQDQNTDRGIWKCCHCLGVSRSLSPATRISTVVFLFIFSFYLIFGIFLE